jgi:hypothetical protein
MATVPKPPCSRIGADDVLKKAEANMKREQEINGEAVYGAEFRVVEDLDLKPK